MAKQWRYQQDGHEFGPVSSDVLKQLASTGKLRRTDRIKAEGHSTWHVAESVKGLFEMQSVAPNAPADEPPLEVSKPVAESRPPNLAIIAGIIAVVVLAVGGGITLLWQKHRTKTTEAEVDRFLAEQQPKLDQLKAVADKAEADLARGKLLDERLGKLVTEHDPSVWQLVNIKDPSTQDEAKAVVGVLMDELGVIKGWDIEARQCVIDSFAWDRLRPITGGRTTVTFWIRVFARGEITLFDSDSGKSIAWGDAEGKAHVFR